MAETGLTAPAVSPAAAVAPGVGAAAEGGSAGSALTGNAPGGGVDLAASVDGTPGVEPAVSAGAEFQILNRKFRDQRHAEEVLGGEIQRVRSQQRENADLKNQLSQFQNEITALRQMVVPRQDGVQGQGMPGGSESQAGPRSFARELAENGELDVIAKIFADPEMGPAHAMYRMAELLDEKQNKSLEQVRDEIRGEMTQQQTRSQQERAVAKAFDVVRNLAGTYPELDESNQADEAIQAQEGILQIISDTFSPEQLAQNPERVLRMAAEEYRHSNGTPMFAQAPGLSGSPSARAAQAAEMAAADSASTPMDGSGVPRQRASGSPETLADKIRRENREVSQTLKTPGGRPLWAAQ